MRLAEYPDDIAFATAIGVLSARHVARPAHPAVPPKFLTEAHLFRRLGISKPLISNMLVRANRNGTTLEAELLASGAVLESTYYEALAEILDLPFLPELDPAQVEDIAGADSQLLDPTVVRLRHPVRPPVTAIVPNAARLGDLAERLAQSPDLRTTLAATTPSALRSALWQAGRKRRLRESVDRLFGSAPEASARITLWGRQGFYTGAALTLTLALAIAEPTAALLVLHIVLSFFFFATFFIRLVALVATKRQQKRLRPAPPPAAGPSIRSSSPSIGRRRSSRSSSIRWTGLNGRRAASISS